MHNIRYAAFLRGINVGGRSIVKMEDLRKVFETLGFVNVKTLLNSGNVIFDSELTAVERVAEKINSGLKDAFGRDIGVMVRSLAKLEELVEADPFKGIHITPEVRLYITFFPEKPQSSLKIPYESAEKDFRIVRVTDGEVCSVLTLSPKRGTVDVMTFVEKTFGQGATTRSWNTVLRVIKLK